MKEIIKISCYIILLFISFSLKSQNDSINVKWKEVSKLESNGLTKSATKIVEDIYNLAIKQNNEQQIIKSLYYKIKYNTELEEAGLVSSINKTETDIKSSSFSNKKAVIPFLHLALSSMYRNYYANNRYIIDQRSITANYNESNFETWDKNKFKSIIIENANLALDDNLKSIKVEDFPDFFNIKNKEYNILYTLYDVIADEILSNIFKDNYYSQNEEKLSDENLFTNAKNFSIMTIHHDNISYLQNSLLIYQKWISFRLTQTNQTEAFINCELARLNFLKNNFPTTEHINELWTTEIENLKNIYESYPEVVKINNCLAEYYINLGDSYHFINNPNHDALEGKEKAMEILEKSVAGYPDAKFSDYSRKLIGDIKSKNYNFSVENLVNKNRNFPIRIEFKNIENLYLTIYECSYDVFNEIEILESEKGKLNKIKSLKLVSTETISLPDIHDYLSHYTKHLVSPLNSGSYLIVLNDSKEYSDSKYLINYQFVQVSDLTLLQKSVSESYNNLYVFNSATGKPISGAEVNMYQIKWKKTSYILDKKYSLKTNKKGLIDIPKDNELWSNYVFEIIFENEKIYSSKYLHRIYRYGSTETSNHTNIFTDRAIYRPGQTVLFKTISYSKNRDLCNVLANYKLTVRLLDVNYQEISSVNLISNEFGSCSGDFVIPTNVLTGQFTIETKGEYQSSNSYIRVEEYKRPNFEIIVNPAKNEYKFNENVIVDGSIKSYSGAALSNAKISYTVSRRSAYFKQYFWLPRESTEEIAYGNVTSDNNGNYSINFKAIVDELNLNNDNIYYNFIVNISATDINGETHDITENILVSNIGLKLSIVNDDIINRENAKEFQILAQNTANKDIPSNVEIVIMSLFTPQVPLRKDMLEKIDHPIYKEYDWYQNYPGNVFRAEDLMENFSAKKIVYKHNINTKSTKSFLPEKFSTWDPGAYRITLKTTDSYGNEITNNFEFILIADKDTTMPYIKPDFFYCDKDDAQPGENVNIKIGSSYRNVTAYYTLFQKNKIIKEEEIILNSSVKNITLPILESYRGGISFNIMFVYDGRIYNFSKTINVEYENKKLNFKSFTLRDLTVEPGQTILGAIGIFDNDSIAVDAEFLANLYDASLDVFEKNNWNFWMYNYYSTYFDNNIFLSVNNSSMLYDNYFINIPYISYHNWDFKLLNIINEEILYYVVEERSSMLLLDATIDTKGKDASVNEKEKRQKSENADKILFTEALLDQSNELVEVEEKVETTNNIRSNFAETAFFYPNLKTNNKGKIEFTFTMPDALTRWNFIGLAHTKDLKIGQVLTSIVSQKDLMLTPNLPRFLREGDIITINSKVTNITNEKISGKAKIELYNAETLENIDKLFKIKSFEKDFVADANNTSSVSWYLEIPEGFSAVGIRITAESDNHVDGEEHILPILTNKMLVTEAIPLPVNKAGTTNFEFKSLKNNKSATLRNEKFTLEYTANPAWYAVQALPYLMEYPYECNEQIFSRYYANALATNIANSDPKIKRVFELWKTTPDSKTLLSNLEKNQELKALFIEETPWLLNGKNENERKNKLAILFDISKMANENNSAIKKLKENQNSDGGWSWFKGNNESSRYITEYIIAGFGHLQKLGVSNNNSISENNNNMIKNAISYIDKELAKSYEKMKKNYNKKYLEENNLNNYEIYYLYARSFFKDIAIPASTLEAFNYYKNQCEKYWPSTSYYEKGMIALILHRFDNSKISQNIIASLKENAIHNEEMGMYWKYSNGWYWYEAPIETQSLLIEMFNEVGGIANASDIEEMKIWLLKQKQTQDWKTTKATSEAIYALLLQGKDLLTSTDLPTITIGKEKINPDSDPDIKTEAGTGYFKKSWNGNEMSKDFTDISVTKKENSASWGAVYWQYFEQLDKIKNFKETPLKINKKLFVERRSEDNNNNLTIIPIEKQELKVGDKITVRIEIAVDRNMEYVHLKDMRASCFEPIDAISGYKWSSGLGYYQSIKDASINFFIDHLSKGIYVFEYKLVVSQKGVFSNGITTMQCMYAPEFTSHSEGITVKVE